jgi:hypothetical protein
VLLCCSGLAAEGNDLRREPLDPVGTWNCLIYGPYGDQRAFIRLADDGKTYIARILDASRRSWVPLSDWRISRGRISFSDPEPARQFSSDADRPTLGGRWRTSSGAGGWWCASVSDERGTDRAVRPPSPAALMTELVPAIMASPSYPRQAIREAKEGRAVSCFLISGSGEISHAEVVEHSDEVFRGPTLAAVMQSRYRSWGDDDADLRPACRNFTFELDAIR